MNIFKRIGSLCAVVALAALTSAAQAQGNGNPLGTNWTYNFTGPLIGPVYDGVSGYGGMFVSTLNNGYQNSGTVVAYNSYCNDLNENINEPQLNVNTTVYQLSNLSTAQLTGTSLVSVDTNGNLIDAGGSVFSSSGTLISAGTGLTNVNVFEYLVATNWLAAQNDQTGFLESALQLAIWHAWGFSNDSVDGYDSSAAGIQAYDWVQAAEANGQGYSNSNVLWVYNSPIQNQIMFIVTPEGRSLVLLLPGLLPIGFAIRRNLRKA